MELCPLARINKGIMGDVYRATDLTLSQSEAVNSVPPTVESV